MLGGVAAVVAVEEDMSTLHQLPESKSNVTMQQKTTTHAGSHSDLHLPTCTVHAHVLSSRAVCLHARMQVYTS